MFSTVLHNLKGPRNVGQIIRSHVAYGGGPLLFVGHDEPWTFKKSTSRYSRKLEDKCDIVHLPTDDAFFDWCAENGYASVAVEIAEPAVFLAEFQFPDRPALIVGHEGRGLSDDFLARCDHIVTIPQHGPVGCLNVAIACSTAMYELRRLDFDTPAIEAAKFAEL
jgi:tRNA G18 (ribose-2'-O)-methylase SpoU